MHAMATLDLEVSDVDSEYSDEFLEDLSYTQSSFEDESHNKRSDQEESIILRARSRDADQRTSLAKIKQVPQNEESVSLKKTARVHMKCSSDSKIDSSRSIAKFNSSIDVRDACYSEWLSRKRSSISLDQNLKQKELEEMEKKKTLKEAEKAERCQKAVEKWSKSKAKELKKAKEKQDLTKKREQDDEEKRHKLMVSKEASEKWREERNREYIRKQREQKRKEKEEAKKENEERAEKTKDAAHAYKAWKERKDGLMKEQKRRQLKEKQIMNNKHKQQKAERLTDSKKAFEAWKFTKDDILKTTKTLYTYKLRPKVHSQAWCPARSMQYDYPKDPMVAKKLTNCPASHLSESPTATASVKSYECESFESDASSNAHSLNGSIVGSETEVLTDIPVTGKRRTIQVCCQTLQYWCTCEHDN